MYVGVACIKEVKYMIVVLLDTPYNHCIISALNISTLLKKLINWLLNFKNKHPCLISLNYPEFTVASLAWSKE